MLDEKCIERIASELSLTAAQVAATVQLLDGGATIPFIAHYRKDATDGLTEAQIETISDGANHFIGLVNRRRVVLEAIARQGVLTEELRNQIDTCLDRTALEDIYVPFKAKRRTKATAAEEQGLAPLAEFILKQLPGLQTVEEFADAFVKPERSISSPEEALDGARFILAERFTMDAYARGVLRERMLDEGTLTTRATKNAEGSKTKFEAYYNFAEPLVKIPFQRLLAILRGERDGLLRLDLTIDEDRMFSDLLAHYITEPGSVYEPHLRLALHEAYTRHLRPALESEVMEIVRKRAEDEAIRVCRENAAVVLLTPPVGAVGVIGMVPAASGTCTLAVIDGQGALVEHQTLALNAAPEGAPSPEGASSPEETLVGLMEKHGAYVIASGNGAGSKEAAKFVNAVLAKHRDKGTYLAVLNSTPAAQYASSRLGQEEIPGVETPVREAVSLARRLQDPLAELVKVEPRSVGVGPYQYEVNQKQLREALVRTVVSCVNSVGVSLSTASAHLLRYASGLQMGTAQNVIATRGKLNGFQSRAQLAEADGIGTRVFEQCAGFLRVPGGENPLDATSIHPEAYPVVERMAESLGVSVRDLIGNAELVGKIDFSAFAAETIGPLTLADIRDELLHPGKDARGQFRIPRFRDGIASVEDLQEGTETEGVVTNVTDFGAFVDIGVHQDGLVHLSELSTRFVKDPHAVIKPGEIVRVKVIKVDKDAPRISLSMKALLVRPRRRPESRPRPEARTRPEGGTRPSAPAVEKPTPDGAEVVESAERPRRRTESRRSAPTDGEEARRPRTARPERRERGHDQDRDRGPRPDRRDRPSSRPPRKPERSAERPAKYGDTTSPLNTQLAEQLAALRDKFGSS